MECGRGRRHIQKERFFLAGMTLDEAGSLVAEGVGDVSPLHRIVLRRVPFHAVLVFVVLGSLTDDPGRMPIVKVFTTATPNSVELVEALVVGKIDALLVADVPFADHAGRVTQSLEMISDCGDVIGKGRFVRQLSVRVEVVIESEPLLVRAGE